MGYHISDYFTDQITVISHISTVHIDLSPFLPHLLFLSLIFFVSGSNVLQVCAPFFALLPFILLLTELTVTSLYVVQSDHSSKHL